MSIALLKISITRPILYFDSMDLSAIFAAVRADGRSERAISLAATGQATAIAMLKAGRKPSADRLRALCDALGLEFYIGPPRPDTEAPGLTASGLRDLEASVRTLVRVVLEAGGDPIPDDLWPVLAKRKEKGCEKA